MKSIPGSAALQQDPVDSPEGWRRLLHGARSATDAARRTARQREVADAIARLSSLEAAQLALEQAAAPTDADADPALPDWRAPYLPPLAAAGVAAAAAATGLAYPALPAASARGASVPWTAFNSSDQVPIIPKALAWLLYQADQELANSTGGGGEFDLERARRLAAHTSVVYCNETNIRDWTCSRCRRAGRMTVYNVVFDEVWDLMAYAGFSHTMGAKIIVFRGTDSHSLYNWIENMHYWRTDFSVPFPNATGALVHSGFVASYNASTLRGNLTAAMQSMQRWHPFTPLYVVGHSLGGALATLCALDMKFTFHLKDVRVHTFGSPRVGNKEFVDYFNWQIPDSWRLTHNRDMVPSVPLQIMGFRHVPREVWQVDFAGHSAITVCDKSGEDPRCHNSMCYLGLCTSISDHLLYLDAHMHHSDTGC